MITDHEFEITLESDAPDPRIMGNRAGSFTNALPTPILLSGDWEVTLMEMQYTHNWFNFRHPSQILFCFNTPSSNHEVDLRLESTIVQPGFSGPRFLRKLVEDSVKTGAITANLDCFLFASIPAGYYASLQELILILNQQIQTDFIRAKRLHQESLDFSFSFDTTTRLLKLSTIGLSAPPIAIGTNLGLNSLLNQAGNQISLTQEASLIPTISSIYVYSDLTRYQYVGDIKAPLLAVLPVHGVHLEKLSWSFRPPQYVPLMRAVFSTINIMLCDDTGEEIPFQPGSSVLIRLHFKPTES